MKRSLVAALTYLVFAGGVGGGYYANYPYGNGWGAALEAAGVGLVWPLVVFEFVAEKAAAYYGKVAR